MSIIDDPFGQIHSIVDGFNMNQLKRSKYKMVNRYYTITQKRMCLALNCLASSSCQPIPTYHLWPQLYHKPQRLLTSRMRPRGGTQVSKQNPCQQHITLDNVARTTFLKFYLPYCPFTTSWYFSQTWEQSVCLWLLDLSHLLGYHSEFSY